MLPHVPSLATVVVCEDDPATLELLCDHLTADRYSALPASCAADALRLCYFKQPNLLLLARALPAAAGVAVLRETRASGGGVGPYADALPILVLSGRASAEDR